MKKTWAPSMAVVACDGHGNGCIVWRTKGSLLDHEIDELSALLSDLGLDDAPLGVSIWEGDYVWRPGSYECTADGELDPVGKFRPPTDKEWEAIRLHAFDRFVVKS